jgi:hypothetical protein
MTAFKDGDVVRVKSGKVYEIGQVATVAITGEPIYYWAAQFRNGKRHGPWRLLRSSSLARARTDATTEG